MIEKYLNRFFGDLWFSRGLAISILLFTFKLTEWGARFAEAALGSKSDLTGTAAIIGAVAAIPLALLTLLFNNYSEKRKANDANNPPS